LHRKLYVAIFLEVYFSVCHKYAKYPVVLKKRFQIFPIFQAIRSHGGHLGSKAMSLYYILEVSHGVSHQSLVQSNTVVLKNKIRM